MSIDFDFFSRVIAGIVRDIASDQIILEGNILSGCNNKTSKIILRNKLNIDILSQLAYMAQNISSSQMQASSLLKSIEFSTHPFDSKVLKFNIDRNKPLLDVLVDRDILVSVLRILFCLLKYENPQIKDLGISLRRRGGYVSMRVESAYPKIDIAYVEDLVTLINSVLGLYGAKLEWRVLSGKRIAYVRLLLAKQISLGYNS